VTAQGINVRFARQDPQHDGFVAADAWYDCAQCVRRHGERHEFPPLDPEHHDAWGIFQAISDQVIVGMDVVGVDMQVLPVWFDAYGIEAQADKRWMLERIAILNHEQQRHRVRQREREAAEKTAHQHEKVAHGR
jgi:hypothetical protein